MLFTEINFRVTGLEEIRHSPSIQFEVTVKTGPYGDNICRYNHQMLFDISDSLLNQYLDHIFKVFKHELGEYIKSRERLTKEEMEKKIISLLSSAREK